MTSFRIDPSGSSGKLGNEKGREVPIVNLSYAR